MRQKSILLVRHCFWKAYGQKQAPDMHRVKEIEYGYNTDLHQNHKKI
jgi:hypothetical protein